MSGKHSTRKNTCVQNRPPSREVKSSLSNKPLEFPTLNPSERYSPHIPSETTPDPTYTSSPNTPNPNSDFSLNEERGVTPDESVFLIPNNEVNQLRQHTRACLKSISQIPTRYQIPEDRSYRITQPYGDNETLAATIDDFIIDAISAIRDHIKQFMLSLRLFDVQHEDVVCSLFPYTFVGQASTWFFSLAAGSIASW